MIFPFFVAYPCGFWCYSPIFGMVDWQVYFLDEWFNHQLVVIINFCFLLLAISNWTNFAQGCAQSAWTPTIAGARESKKTSDRCRGRAMEVPALGRWCCGGGPILYPEGLTYPESPWLRQCWDGLPKVGWLVLAHCQYGCFSMARGPPKSSTL